MNKYVLTLSGICFLLFANYAYGQWVQTGLRNTDITALGVSGSNIFAGTFDYNNTPVGVDMFLSTDNGVSWTAVDNGLPTNSFVTAIRTFAVSGNNIFAGTMDSGVFLSTNNGALWTAVNNGMRNSHLYPYSVYALAVSGSNIFAGTDVGIFLSTNNGALWTAVDTGGLMGHGVNSFAVSGSNVFAGTDYSGVFLSTNNGASWTAVNNGLPTNPYVTAIRTFAVSGSNIFASTDSGIFLSTNNGALWSAVNNGLMDLHLYVHSASAFAVSGSNIFAGTDQYGVHLSKNNGALWTAVDGLADAYITALVVSGNNIFAGTSDSGVYRRPISELLSVLPQHQRPAPLQTRLRISASGSLHSGVILNYCVQAHCLVHLGIYTISGRQVAFIEQQERSPGEYSVRLDGGQLPPGFYICHFQAGSYQESSRIMVIK